MEETSENKRWMTSLMEVPNCPWCGSQNRIESVRYSAKANHYLSDLAQFQGKSSRELLDLMKAFKCIDCQTSYLDPFIRNEVLEEFFSDRKYSHRAGWGKFLDIIKRGNNSQTYLSSFEKFKSISKFFEDPYEYYEVGCPFMGFLLVLGNNGDLSRTISRFYNNQESHLRENNFGSIVPSIVTFWISRIRRKQSYFSYEISIIRSAKMALFLYVQILS